MRRARIDRTAPLLTGLLPLARSHAHCCRHRGNTDRTSEIEAAYDLIFMQQMKARLSGACPALVGWSEFGGRC